MPDHLLEAIAATVVLLGTAIANHIKGAKREKSQGRTLERGFADLHTTIETRCNQLQEEIRTVSAHVIGPDGENGLRGDVREIKARVIGLEEREREHLAGERLHNVPDRRRPA